MPTDTLFNATPATTMAFGSPDILDLFKDVTPPATFSRHTYPADMEDFAAADASVVRACACAWVALR